MKRLLALDSWVYFILYILITYVLLKSSVIEYIGIVLSILYPYLLGKSLYELLPENHNLKYKRFLGALIFITIYSFTIYTHIDEGYSTANEAARSYGWKNLIIVPLTIFLFVCIFYINYFISKSIALIMEHKQSGATRVMFSDYIGNFLCFWFYPFGVWIVQPRIKRILTEQP